MHQLRALIWKSYKVRTRQYYMTILDLFGPILVISLYIGVKVVLNYTHEVQLDDDMKASNYFHNNASTNNGQINLKQDIRSRMCQKVLYHSSFDNNNDVSFSSYLTNECGLQLDRVSTRDELVNRLKTSLDLRVAFQRSMTDLNKINSTVDNCIRLPSNNAGSSTDAIYQIGIERANLNSFELHMTDSAGSSVVHVPYTQGSTYNEYKLPISDLNLGSYLIEMCLLNALQQDRNGLPSTSSTTTTATTTTATTRQASSSTSSISSSTTVAPSGNKTNETDAGRQPPVNKVPKLNDINWRIRPYPVITGVYLIPISTAIMIMLAFLCTNIATILRLSEASEFGLHRYSRLSGVPSGYYWLSEFIVSLGTNFVYSFVVAIILSVGSGDYPYDPFADSSVTLRWMVLFTYSSCATAHSIFFASLMNRSAHALIGVSFLASAYAMQPLWIIIQWTPYGFSQLKTIEWLFLFNPAAIFEALNEVMAGVAMQTGKPFSWVHLSERIVNGGFTSMSAGECWLHMLVQIIIFLIITILIDQYRYGTTTNPIGFVMAQLNEFCCCNSLGYSEDRDDLHKTITAKSTLSAISKRDPNRICCSLRNIEVSGPTKMMPYSKGNPLRLTREQLHNLRKAETSGVSKTTQYMVNRRLSGVNSQSNQKDQPILLDAAIEQHIIWCKTRIKFESLSLDFRFNQVTFILGQTDLKELLFDTLLGMCPLRGGQVTIGDTSYLPSTMSLARPQIGYLSDRDIFYQELTIFENLQLFGSLRDPAYKSYDSESLFVLSLLHLSHSRNEYPSSLTQRSARKLALAVALVGYTKLLLLTEPTLNLRWRPRCQVYNLLKKYKSIRSIVVDTSDVDEAVAFGDRVVLLKNGSADMNDEPKRLARKLGCGYWLVFEPTTGDGRTINSEAIRAMEKLTHDIFKHDKIDLDATKRSVYQDLDHLEDRGVASRQAKSKMTFKSDGGKLATKVSRANDTLHRVIVVVKIQHTSQSERGLCSILKMFSKNNIHGFRLVQVNYESLEDIIVLRMSRAIYPELPPDLLLSLQHRTQVDHKTQDTMPVSVRRLSSGSFHQQQTTKSTIFDSSIATIIKDRFSDRSELVLLLAALFGSFILIAITLLSLRYSLKSDDKFGSSGRGTNGAIGQRAQTQITDHLILEHKQLDRLYKYRIGFYILERDHHQRGGYEGGQFNEIKTINGNASSFTDHLLQSWQGNKNLLGVVNLAKSNQTDSQIVAALVDKSMDLAGSLIIYDPLSSETFVIYEPHLPHMLLASIRAFSEFALSIGSSNMSQYRSSQQQSNPSLSLLSSSSLLLLPTTSSLSTSSSSSIGKYSTTSRYDNNHQHPIETSRYNFHQPWHEMVHGFPIRRIIYGIGFAFAEAISVGFLIAAPMRHRNASRSPHTHVRYWIRMAIVDLFISSLNIVSYLILFMTIEGVTSGSLIFSLYLVLFIYKLASLPIPYLTSLVAESGTNGFLFILMLYLAISYDLAVCIRTYVDWTLISSGYTYTVTNWVFFGLPITALIDSLVVINQINTIQALCAEVPAFAATRNSLELDGVHKYNMVDSLLEKIHECLANGKVHVSTNVLHGHTLGVLWPIYLMLLFAAISWIFLLTCERFFGFFARKSSFNRTSSDPIKTFVRIPDASHSGMFAWEKERDRLVSEYIRCINEKRYVRLMTKHCLILRVWLKPMDNQATMEGRLSTILDPLISLGYSKNDAQIEMRTTLQVFIRLGDETRQCRVDKITLIETYSKYAAAHSDIVAKFAVVDWTQENLYKILLHGYYNNKTVLSS